MKTKLATIAALTLVAAACADDDRVTDTSVAYEQDNTLQPTTGTRDTTSTTEQTRAARGITGVSPGDEQVDEHEQDSVTADAQRDTDFHATGEEQQEIVVSDTAFLGKALKGSTGEEIGEIEKVVRDRTSNDRMLVVDVEGIIGDGMKQVVIPAKDVKMSADGDSVRAAMTKEQLESRPEYDESMFDASY